MRNRPHVILYTRHGCHLCDEAKAEIARAGLRDAYTYEEVDIDTDPSLKARYGWDVPVVRIDGTDTFRHRLTAEQFRQSVSSKR